MLQALNLVAIAVLPNPNLRILLMSTCRTYQLVQGIFTQVALSLSL